MGVIETGQLIAEHYRLLERIGSGGAGVVWRALDERLERIVAVKQIPIQLSLPESERAVVRQRAIREARNAARFHHPNAIVVFDITEHEGQPCLVMEYFASQSLAEVLAEHRTLPLPQVAWIGREVASALIAADKAGIVHRDIKPGNILLDRHGAVKITDFGISRAVDDVALTATGLVSGTAAYLPPEVARGADPTSASDVFGLGATLFHALEGESPYGANQNPLAMLYAAANGQMGEPRRAGPATDLLLSLLSPRPEDRPTLSQARAGLARFADSDPEALAESTQVMPQRGEKARRTAKREASKAAFAAPRPAPANTPAPRVPPPAPYTVRSEELPTPPKAKRPIVYIGSLVLVVLTVLALVYAVVNMSDLSVGGEETPETVQTDLGQSASSGTQVAWGEAGQLVDQFYDNPGAGWALLTPAAQQVYGSQADLQSYWSSRIIQSYGRIEAYKLANNADGSVDMRINGLTYDGQTKQLILRVVDSGGSLLIDGDTR